MTPRHVALVIAAVAVLGLGVYLYVAVHSTTDAGATVRARSAATKPAPEPPTEAPTEEPAQTLPAKNRKATFSSTIRESATVGSGEPQPATNPGANIDFKKDEMMASANKAYDHGDFDEAIVIAKKVLSNDPANTRMLRIMVSASCLNDDAETARKNYSLLAANGNDRADMRRRCERYGITFPEP